MSLYQRKLGFTVHVVTLQLSRRPVTKVTPDRRRPSFHDAEHRTTSTLLWQNETCVDILRTKSSTKVDIMRSASACNFRGAHALSIRMRVRTCVTASVAVYGQAMPQHATLLHAHNVPAGAVEINYVAKSRYA